MKMKKYTDKMIVDQIRYMCELWQKGMFEGCADSLSCPGRQHIEDIEVFTQAIIDTCNAKGKTERYIDKIMEKDLHLNG